MGNKNSCCVVPGPGRFRRSSKHRNSQLFESKEQTLKNGDNVRHSITAEESCCQLQHISDREPDDLAEDPSLHPTTGPLFLAFTDPVDNVPNGFSVPLKRRSRSRLSSASPLTPNGLRKSSSCSTIFLDDSTITQPNLKHTIKAVSLAVFFHIKNRKSERGMDVFDEKSHPLSKEGPSSDVDRLYVENRSIYRFVRTLFSAAQLTAECAIVTLVYLERLLTYAELDVTPRSWRRMVLGATLLASKVWDDQAVYNVDYCQILKDTTVEDMNQLEKVFLEMLQFNINVPSSVYAKYYFHLRALAEANDFALQMEPLSKERAFKLEAMSRFYEFKIIHTGSGRSGKNGMKRGKSLDNVFRTWQSAAVLP
ncbi:unnamed protein product [Notodromas monacha]|uniref:Cyclin-like domain-containing protein n=1 Tax=Notodromas monacha TaxID=399045 RepID=A0A7R9GGU0_9CRUS|nr:unnamed protein product [Notodromas monacha]CAG0920575.1 unnamed protein product [Notodromas monacha]